MVEQKNSFFQGNSILRFFSKIIKKSEPIEAQENKSLQHYVWDYGNSNLIKDNNILCQMIDNQVDYNVRCLLITFISNKYSQPIFIIRDNTKNKNYTTDFERMFFCDNLQSFQNWLDRKRKFEHHTKHDAAKRKNNKSEDVSILYFDPVKDFSEIEKLLNEAIAENKDSNKILYNYDTQHKLYIKFYAHRENVELYHAFHIAEDKEYEIPQIIKNDLRKIKQTT